ncbi:MAG: peptidylprolyl isomerase [Dehalococcoidia bacterium]|nr:peptidylprolyl isomerase [Dehalococcoidia bacterium]
MMRFWPLLGASALFAVLAFACKGDGGTPKGETPASSPALAPTPKTYSERPAVTIGADKKYSAVVETTKGKFTIELRPDIALQTVNSFIFLSREGFYNGVTFHRVLSGFVAQTGDPTGTGSGGPGYTLPAEFSDVPFERGTVAMARVGSDINSAGSQWFVTYNDKYQNVLNGQYTVFGKVVEGMEVVDALTPRDPENVATPQPEGDRIISIEIKEG